MAVTVHQALFLIQELTRAVDQFCQRRDIVAALIRTEPLEV